jgi:hypothetical protein
VSAFEPGRARGGAAYGLEALIARLLVVGLWLAMGLVLVGVVLMLATGTLGGSLRRAIETATHTSSTANRPASTCSLIMNAIRPPTRAPAAENSSSVMPSRRLATCRWR